MKSSVAPRTLSLYESAGREFAAFRESRGLETTWPVPIDHLMEYCVFLHNKGLVTGTIKGKLAGLSFSAKLHGWSDTTADGRIRRMLEGWSRLAHREPDSRRPITPELLRGLRGQWNSICSSQYEQCLFHATALTAFNGAFRMAEVLAKAKADTTRTALWRSDLACSEQGAVIFPRKSKTDQKGQGARVELHPSTLSEICPVKALLDYLALRGERSGYLFCHTDGGPLTIYQFWTIAKKALLALGLDGFRFGTHSFRIGAASTAAASGFKEQDIKAIGRWRSKAYKTYVRK